MTMSNMFLKRSFSICRDKLNKYDFIICGGGMIGTTLACALASNALLKDKSILLLEGGPKKSYNVQHSYSNRVSAINMSSKHLFKELGIWENIKNIRYQKVNGIKVWGCYSKNSTNFKELDASDIAYIVENDVIIEAASKKLNSLNNVEVVHNALVKDLVLPSEDKMDMYAELKLSDSSKYNCNLLIGADGANSKVRKTINPQYLSWSYDQSAIVATLKIAANSSNTTAWQRFTQDGPVALLPLSNELSSLVWTTSHEKAKKLLKLSNEDFVDELNSALIKPSKSDDVFDLTTSTLNKILDTFQCNKSTEEILPPYISEVQDGSRAAFPLGFGHSTKYIGPKVVLIGDAAHKVHPLAGQGVNLGFSDIKILSECLSEGVAQGRSIDDILILENYQKITQRHNIPVMVAIDLFHRLFTSNVSIIKAIGDVSFKVADNLKPIKNGMKWFASGSV